MTAVPESSALERLEGLKPRGPLRLAGLIGRFDADSVHAIPALWSRLVPRLPLAGQRGWETYGACIYDGPTAAEDFRYMAAVEIEPGAPAPDGLEALEVAPQSYAVWRLTLDGGPLHPQMRAAAQDIWGRRLKAEGLKPSGGPDFELYPGDFDQDRAGSTVGFWVPVAG